MQAILHPSLVDEVKGFLCKRISINLFRLCCWRRILGLLCFFFLSAVQLMVYAGGIIVLYVFSILLTRSSGTMKYKIRRGKMISVLLTTLVGMALVMFILATNGFALNIIPQGVELPVEKIGNALIGTEKYQFVLPFEVMSVLLLACMIGAIMIARKRK